MAMSMSKVNSIKSIAALVLAAQVFIPSISPAYAAKPAVGIDMEPITTVNPGQPEEEQHAAYCARITALVPQIVVRLADRKANLEARRAERNGYRAAGRAAQRGALDQLRSNDDAVRSSTIAKLDVRAKTTAHKAAILKFKTSMEAAVAARKSAMSAAQKNFYEGVDAIIAGRKASDNASLSTYSNAVTAAFNTAKSDCIARRPVATIKEKLRNSLQAAREQFLAGRSQLEPQDAEIRGLIETRQTATKKAFDDFKAKAETARVEIKAAFAAEGTVK